MSFFGYMRKTYFQTSFFVLLFLIEKVWKRRFLALTVTMGER